VFAEPIVCRCRAATETGCENADIIVRSFLVLTVQTAKVANVLSGGRG